MNLPGSTGIASDLNPTWHLKPHWRAASNSATNPWAGDFAQPASCWSLVMLCQGGTPFDSASRAPASASLSSCCQVGLFFPETTSTRPPELACFDELVLWAGNSLWRISRDTLTIVGIDPARLHFHWSVSPILNAFSQALAHIALT